MQENCCAEHLVEKDEKLFSHTRPFDLIGRLIIFLQFVNLALIIRNESTLLLLWEICLGFRIVT